MKQRFGIPALVVLVLLLGAYLLRRQAGSGPAPGGPAPGQLEEAAPAPDFAAYEAPQDSPRSPRVPLPDPSAAVIPGELTVFFSTSESLDAFLEAARGGAVRVLGTLPELLAVRVAASGADLDAYLGEDAGVGFNYVVSVPVMLDLDLWQSLRLQPLEGRVPAFLGAPSGQELLGWGSGVTIAVLDTGWGGHPALSATSVRLLDLVGTPLEG